MFLKIIVIWLLFLDYNGEMLFIKDSIKGEVMILKSSFWRDEIPDTFVYITYCLTFEFISLIIRPCHSFVLWKKITKIPNQREIYKFRIVLQLIVLQEKFIVWVNKATRKK